MHLRKQYFHNYNFWRNNDIHYYMFVEIKAKFHAFKSRASFEGSHFHVFFLNKKLKFFYESPRASKEFNNSVSKIIMIKFLFTSISTFPKAILNKSDIFESVVTWCVISVSTYNRICGEKFQLCHFWDT